MNPRTKKDYISNVNFQLSNVEGYMSIKDYESALIKADCVVSALKDLIEKLKNDSATEHPFDNDLP